MARFCALLDEEREVLGGTRAERLQEIAAEKAALATELSRMESRRETRLAGEGLLSGRRGMDAWLASHPNASAERGDWQQLLELAARARDGNAANGRLINLLLQQNQEALSLLVAGGAGSIYGTDGQSHRVTEGKRSLGKA